MQKQMSQKIQHLLFVAPTIMLQYCIERDLSRIINRWICGWGEPHQIVWRKLWLLCLSQFKQLARPTIGANKYSWLMMCCARTDAFQSWPVHQSHKRQLFQVWKWGSVPHKHPVDSSNHLGLFYILERVIKLVFLCRWFIYRKYVQIQDF